MYRAVRSVVLFTLGVIAPLLQVACDFRSNEPQSAAGDKQGLGETIAPMQPPRVGERAPDFSLRDLDGREVRLSDYRGHMPVVIEFGSLSCPIVTGRCNQLDKRAEYYKGKAQFLFIYGNEEHPGNEEKRSTSFGTFWALPQAKDYLDRCEHARQFRNTMKTSRRILVDEDGAANVSAQYGIRGHGMVIVDAQGRISAVGDGISLLADLDIILSGLSPAPVHYQDRGVVRGIHIPSAARGVPVRLRNCIICNTGITISRASSEYRGSLSLHQLALRAPTGCFCAH
jgi:hypothetical protein